MPYIPITESGAPQISGTFGAPRTSGPGKTFQKLKQELLAELANRGDLAGREGQWINDSYIEMAREIKFDELKVETSFNTVVDQPFYRIPDTFHSLTGAGMLDADHLDGGYPLDKIDEMSYKRLPDTTGKPSTFFRFNRVLVVWPTPDDVYEITVGGLVLPAELSNPEDMPIFSGEWHSILGIRAKALALAKLREYDASGMEYNEYTVKVRQQLSVQGQEKEDAIMGISVPRKASDLHRRRV